MAERRRLNSLDLLPAEAQDDLIWAIGELNQRQRSQADILFEFNDRLAVKGIDPVSKSAFSRASVRLAKRSRQIEERRLIYSGIASKLTPEAVAENDHVLAEFLKNLIDEMIDSEGLTPKAAMELARAYLAVVTAQRTSSEHRRKLQLEARERIEKAVKQATDGVAEAGHAVDPELILRTIRQAYGGDA